MERIRSLLTTAGSDVRKHEVVRALADMRVRQLVQISAGRHWQVLERLQTSTSSPSLSSATDDYLISVCCQVFSGEAPALESEMVADRIEPSIDLLVRLLPYYQESLKANDGGSPKVSINQHGDAFMLIQPTGRGGQPWNIAEH